MSTAQPYFFVFGGRIPHKPGEPAMVSLKSIHQLPNVRSAIWKVRACTSSLRNTGCSAPVKVAFLGSIGEAGPEEALRRDVRQTRLALLKGEEAIGSGAMQLTPSNELGAPLQRGQTDEFSVQVDTTLTVSNHA
jgi:hypothetical protein